MTRPGSRSLIIAVAVLAVCCSGIRTSAAQVPATAETTKARRSTTIKSIKIDRSGDLWIVKIEADGPLPAPTIGELDAPARVFLDFSGVTTRTTAVRGSEGAPVVRVRSAVNSASPLVSRVVIDLAAKQPIRTEDKQIESGRFNVLVGEVAPTAAEAMVGRPAVASAEKASAPRLAANADRPAPTAERPTRSPVSAVPAGIPPVDALPPPVRPAAPETPAESGPPSPPGASPVPARSTTRPVPARDAERYLDQIGAPLRRYQKLRPTLSTIDQQDPKLPEDLSSVREECAAVLRALTAFHPSDALRPTHELLVRSVSFALMATTLRNDAGTRAEPEKLRNAAAAAAGALLLLDRACMELGCSPSEARRN